MTRYCGQCGTVLGVSSLRAGRCSTCGAVIEPTDETYDVGAMALADNPTQEVIPPARPPQLGDESIANRAGIVDGAYGGDHTESTGTLYTWLPRRSPPGGTRALFWTLALLSSTAVLIVAVSLFFLAQHGPLRSILTPIPSSSPSGASGAASATAHSGVTASPGGALATATQSVGLSTATPTSGPPPTTFAVSPTSISIAVCTGSIYKIVNFTISNTGGAPLYWTATKSVKGYSVTPSSGTLGSGLHVKVYLAGILRSGFVTVSATNAADLPQQVDITCGL